MKVSDAMHREATWCSPDEPVSDLARRMQSEDIGAIPIGENDRLVGMVTDRDIALRGFADGRDRASLTARDVMSEGIVWCSEEQDLDDALELMQQHQVRRLPVINAKKRLVGVLSLGDIAHAAPRDRSGELLQSVAAHH